MGGNFISIILGGYYFYQWQYLWMDRPCETHYTLQKLPTLWDCISIWTHQRKNSSMFTSKMEILSISKRVQRVFSTQTLINQVWSLILMIFTLSPPLIYPPQNKNMNCYWFWSLSNMESSKIAATYLLAWHIKF